MTSFVGFDEGGHLLVGHDAQVQAEVLALLSEISAPEPGHACACP